MANRRGPLKVAHHIKARASTAPGPAADATSQLACGILRVHRTGLRRTSLHRFQATAIFYPIFYPNRQRSRVKLSGDDAAWRGAPYRASRPR